MSEAKKRPRPIIIGVTGGSGSGKTSVSRAIFDQLHGHSLMMLQEDSYYKSQDDIPFEERTKVNYDHPNAFDTDLLMEPPIAWCSGLNKNGPHRLIYLNA